MSECYEVALTLLPHYLEQRKQLSVAEFVKRELAETGSDQIIANVTDILTKLLRE